MTYSSLRFHRVPGVRLGRVPFIERLEPRTLLAVDFALLGALAVSHDLALVHGRSHVLDFYRDIRKPPIKFDKVALEELNEGGEEEPPDIAFDPTVTPGAAAPVLAGTIDAVTFDQDASGSGYYHIPPDSSGAAGPSHVVNVVNATIQWYTKAGAQENSQRLGKNSSTATGSFFAAQNPLTGTFDARVLYDQYNSRFVVVTLERTDTVNGAASNTSRLLIAVSDDSNPNGTWYTTAINTKVNISGTDRWMDYPCLGIDANAIYVTGNMFSFGSAPGFGGSRLWIISKSGLYTGGAPTSSAVYDPSTLASLPSQTATMQPTTMFGSAPGTTGTFLVSSGWASGSIDLLSVIRVTNPLSSPTFSNTFVNLGDVHQNSVSFPGSSPQLGSAKTIANGDTRMQSAMWRNNTIWAANTLNPVSGADAGTPTAHWYKIGADSATIGASPLDQGNIGGEDIAVGTRTFYPAITVDSSNNMGIGFSASGTNIYPGAYYTGRLSGDPAGTVQPAAALAAGQSYYFRAFGGGSSSRWGDYSSISLDPSDNATFWLFNEYALTRGSVLSQYPTEDGRWGTRFGSFAFALPVSATPGVPDLVAGSDTGVSPTDDITGRDNSTAGSTLQFSVGSTVSGATVTLYADGNVIGSVVAAGTTTTVITNGIFDLTDGAHTITARQTESGKTLSASSGTLNITIDTVAPTITTASFQYEIAPQQLIYVFSEDVSVTLSSGDVVVASVPAGNSPTLAAPSWTPATKTATFDFSSTPVPKNNYTATIAAAGVTDVAGNPLPADHLLSFFFVPADGDHNKSVGIQDFNTLAANYGTSGKTFSQGNFDYSANGLIDINDFNILAANYGASVP